MLVLGVETSCDDTAAAVIRREASGACTILSNEIWTDAAAHQAFGGVVPEIAARSHVEKIDVVIQAALGKAGLAPHDLDAVAATAGPGLIGGVMVGLTTAKAIALAHSIRLVPVNHLEGHALTARMTEALPTPYLLLLISGGHTQLILVSRVGVYERLGSTIDDAAGEAFDKTAKLLGLGQPGGPRVEAAAAHGDPARFPFPAPLARREGCDFSLSGLKTALRLAAESLAAPSPEDRADLCASFQTALAAHLAQRTRAAMRLVGGRAGPSPRFVVAGGVAANRAVRAALERASREEGFIMSAPPLHLCTDNGAMIAWAGAERLAAGLAMPQTEALAFAPRARWPLAPPIEGHEIGGGKRGPKA